ncbi:uncharacterized protein LOC128559952 [Mercenaria mercenaria]|uniref:uncharacterized protein LOC128559952 n=1 Tax=Mercenaria mercenaria TaxID=6596 RepID=UPI00234E7A5E|nr:uncharacterized protein LOC128559952 [Mercenaria mercenaria]
MDDMAGEKSVIRGSSHLNQWIERWWRFLRQETCDYWMNFFAGMGDEGLLSTSEQLHIEIVRFCFTDLIQRDLDRAKAEWNSHRIRPCRSTCPSGKPDLMYYIPQLFDTVDYKVEVNIDDLNQVTAT